MLEEITELNVTNIVLHKTEDDSDSLIKLYGIVKLDNKQWFVAKTKSIFLANTKALFELGCKPSYAPIQIQDHTQPSVGDVVSDIHNHIWKICTVEWL